MKYLLSVVIVLAGALQAQGYTAGTVTNAFAANEIYTSGNHIKTLQNTWAGFLGNIDEGHAEDYPIGFSFDFYGQAYTSIDICTNGWVSFSGITGQYPYLPAQPASAVPDAAYPNGEICVSYHDMFIYGMSSNSPDGIYGLTTGTAPNREFRVEWKYLRSMQAQGTTSVVLILFETTNRIEIHFDPAATLPPHATGIEDQAGTNGVASAGGWMQLGPQSDAYDFTPIAGTPEIDVTINGAAAADGIVLALGNAPDDADLDVVIAVSNVGSANLQASTISVANEVNCTVAAIGGPFSGSIAPGSNEARTLRITPAGAGPYSFDVSVANDDADEGPYDLTLGGTFTPTSGGGGGGGGVGGLGGGDGGGGGCAASHAVVNGLDLALLMLMAAAAALRGLISRLPVAGRRAIR
jgi:hypothetical protein